MMLAQIKPDLMKEYIGAEFEILDDPMQVFSLTLTDVTVQVKTQLNESFSLFFHGPTDRFMRQGIHKLKHTKLGELEIFLVPVAQDKDGFQYEAAFNRMLS